MQSLPGSIGPTQSGVEHIAGVYAGSHLVKPKFPHWPNAWCTSWCDRAHRLDVPSWTSTSRVRRIGGEPARATASAQDLRASAYLLRSRSADGAVVCSQRIYAHRSLKHLLLSEFECTNQGAAAAEVELEEPGPSNIFGADGEVLKGAPRDEAEATPVPSGIEGVGCSRLSVKVGETPTSAKAVVGECHSLCDGRRFAVPPRGRRLASCLSARHSSVDDDEGEGEGIGVDPVDLARSSWRDANASATSLYERHEEAQRVLLRPGIEVEGDLELARVINISMEAMLASYREDTIPGAGSGGLMSDGYAGNLLWDVETRMLPNFNLFYPAIR